MTESESERSRQRELLSFIRGWKRAAAGSAFTDEEMNNPDFEKGFKQGRMDQRNVYEEACKFYGTQLSELRPASSGSPKPGDKWGPYELDKDGWWHLIAPELPS